MNRLEVYPTFDASYLAVFKMIRFFSLFLQLLLTAGVVFESIPVSVVLPGGISNQSVILTGIPKEVGQLEIKGTTVDGKV